MQILPGKPIPIRAAHPGPTAAPAPPARSWGPGGGFGAGCPLLPAALRHQRRAARSLVGAHPSSKLSEYTCVYIGLMQPWNRGRETSKARGLEGRACRGGAPSNTSCPVAWALHPPQAPIRGARPSSSIFLAYILQQYRDTPCARCRGAAAAPGAEAGPVPRLQPWHQRPRSRRRPGTGCGAQLPLDYGGHPPSRGGPISPLPLLLHPGEQGALGELPAEAVLPSPVICC